ncbi:MAG: hypothetical protein B7Y90_11420 [Alphaproteobacteria bacterium 32-64-14]|nr:MAG: hypothetical protein B7Y90_11420 [Alphaproteobacteria bacterium 32-64-14]
MIQREYTWSSIFAWGLTLSGAVLATGGVIGMFWPKLDISGLCVVAFAGMMAFGIGLVNCAASGAMHAIKHRKPDGRQVEWAVLLPALICCVGFVFATNVGVHLGWEIVIANAPEGAKLPPAATVDAVFYIFAFAKPAMAWIVEGRKSMDAEDYEAHRSMRRREASEMADAEMVRAEFARASAMSTDMEFEAEAVEPTPDVVAATEPVAPETVADTPAEAPQAKPARGKRKPKSVEEQRAAAMKAAAKRVAQYREKHMGRVTDFEHARLEQNLSVQQIAHACDQLILRGEKPSQRRVAEILGVSQMRVEKVWPVGVPLDGTGEVRAA